MGSLNFQKSAKMEDQINFNTDTSIFTEIELNPITSKEELEAVEPQKTLVFKNKNGKQVPIRSLDLANFPNVGVTRRENMVQFVLTDKIVVKQEKKLLAPFFYENQYKIFDSCDQK